jgi:uncharacterized protein (TIGR02099 family)
MRPWFRKLVKAALVVVTTGVLLAFAATIGFRMLLERLPGYQTELQAWVSRELGVQLQFAGLEPTWGLRGPELTFRDARVASGDGAEPFLTARMARVGFSPFNVLASVVARRAPAVERLTFEGTELTLVKTAEGTYRLRGVPSAASRAQDLRLDVPPEIDVLVSDSRVLYLDPDRSIAWTFENVEGGMRRADGALTLEASARPPPDLAERARLTAQGFLADRDGAEGADPRSADAFTGDWRVSIDVENVDLAVAAGLLPESSVVPKAGHGDVALWAEWQRRELVSGTVALALRDVTVPTVLGTSGSSYDAISFKGDWQRDANQWSFGLRDVEVTRAGRAWPASAQTQIEIGRDSSGALARLAVRSDFLRLEDLTPFLAPLPQSSALDSWLTLAPTGDVRDLSLELERGAERLEYTLAARFTGLGFEPIRELPGVDSLAGEVRADSRSGRMELHTGSATLDWPALFREPLALQAATGLVVWRQGQDALRVVSDDLVLETHDASLRSNLELTLPLDGGSPLLDLETSTSNVAIAAVPRYLPAHKMPTAVVDWLDDGLQGGLIRTATVTFYGPLEAFPFDAGEGELRAVVDIEDGRLGYARDWPWAEDLDGRIEFVNASFAAHGSGRTLGNRTSNLSVGIPDLRTGLLRMQLDAVGPLPQVLEYLQTAPLIARSLGPDFARLEAPRGDGVVSVDLRLPLKNRNRYDIDGSLDMRNGELAFRGFGPRATEIRGKVALHGSAVTGEGIQAVFLDGPVTLRVDSPNMPGYRARVSLDGEVSIDSVAKAFDLPFPDLLAGQTTWQAELLIPSVDAQPEPPPRVTVDSNLSGVAMRFPAPFAKAPSEPTNLEVELVFGHDGGLDMQGHIGASRRFALQFDPGQAEGRFAFRRAALRFGGALPEFRAETGVTVDGRIGELDVDEWLALRGDGNGGAVAEDAKVSLGSFAGADLDVTELEVFGQKLGATKAVVRRRTDDWQLEIDSKPVAGTLLIPVNLSNDPRIVAVMRRLYLNPVGDGGIAGTGNVDPRRLPGLQLHSDEFAVGQRQLGRLDAEILSDSLGLRLVSFESATDSFSAQGSGGWFRGDSGDTTRFAVSLTSSNVAKTLDQLGFDPVLAAETLDMTASVYWPGPPSGNWMEHVGGDFALHAKKGSLLDVQPGAGRMVGLLSVTTLPRRLALDFRDVFNKGLVFDEINGDFTVIDGNAYTDNLKVTGPVAEIGLIGRTGLRDRDYRQQAVVTAEPGNVLPTVGLLGGPAVAAALLIFTRIFKEPLKGIGRASYCLSGSWNEPMVERLTPEQLERGEICAELPPNGLGQPAGVAAR